ncbi:MAG: hemerythrin domain-containing protein [Myxococcaceae bacterium]|nr:hemerythrin domain-containing protein [Myxococcaceae bacterium]MCI0669407.1 hemerythrin domain-containing protein [Myxococcaceae bacterium]
MTSSSAHPDIYAGIHKALRRRLFSLCTQAGTTDGADAFAVEALAHAAEGVFASLRAHGEHEERFFHPLLARDGQVRASLDDAHVQHEAALSGLEQRLAQVSAESDAERRREWVQGFYLELCAFTGDFLLHLDEEERRAFPVLVAHCTADEVSEAHRALLAAMSPEERTRDLLSILEASSPDEAAFLLDVLARSGSA